MVGEEFIVVDGIRTRVVTAGPPDGIPLLLLHDGGWGGCIDMSWESMLPLWAERYRVIAPDLVGYGSSDKVAFFDRSPTMARLDHVLGVLRELRVDSQVHVVGNSFGGTIAVRALTRPGHAAQFASVTSMGGTGGPFKADAAQGLADFDGTREGMAVYCELLGLDRYDFVDYIDRRHKWACTPGHFQVMEAPRIAVPEHMRATPAEDGFPASLRVAEVPLLLIHGKDDDLLLPDWMERLAAHVPRTETAVVAGGHCPNLTIPEQTFDVVDGFLRSIT